MTFRGSGLKRISREPLDCVFRVVKCIFYVHAYYIFFGLKYCLKGAGRGGEEGRPRESKIDRRGRVRRGDGTHGRGPPSCSRAIYFYSGRGRLPSIAVRTPIPFGAVEIQTRVPHSVCNIAVFNDKNERRRKKNLKKYSGVRA